MGTRLAARARWYGASALCAGLLGLGATRAPQTPALDAGLAAFWASSSDKDAARAIDQIVRSGASFDEVYARLAAGRPYSADIPRGEFRWPLILQGGVLLPITIAVPRDYDPHTRYPVRVYLHGGVMRESPQEGERRAPRRRLECGGSCIGVYPTGSIDAPWWTAIQIESLDRTLARLRRLYNVDENHVHLMGVSDGATGVYFAGLRDATRWSALFPFNGHPRVLANPAVGADGELFLANLANTPLYIVNGGQDPMYPAATLEAWVAALGRAGAQVMFRPQMAAGHETSWWPAEGPLVEDYERAHPRDPLPDRVSWQTERTDRYNRFRWLIIHTLDSARAQSPRADADDLFEHRRPSGRVDLERSGNTVRARTRGVGAFTLLLSPAEFDFGKPITVIVNGQTASDGIVQKDVSALLRWAARDLDRTMLFGAELNVDVPR